MAAAALALAACTSDSASGPPPGTVATGNANAAGVGIWAAAPMRGVAQHGDPSCPSAPGAFTDGTVRDIVHPERSATQVRIRLSNAFGTAPLRITSATVAQQASGAALDASTIRPLSFGGGKDVTIDPGHETDSDFTDLTVSPEHDLAVSFHVSGLHGPVTFHAFAFQQNYVAKGTSDQSDRTDGLTGQQTDQCWLFLDGVDEAATADVAGSVVAFGDSITDGQQSTVGSNARWPDDLARRLDAEQGRTLSVVDEGIGGNRLLSAGPLGVGGPSGVSRFARDALGQPGVRTVVLLEGVNDIGASDLGRTQPVSAQTIEHADEKLIDDAHARHVRVIGATLTPFQGAGYWSPQGEHVREQLDDWILHGGAFDGIVDFGAAVADPQHPTQLASKYDSGDHLHPNDAGYAAMAAAINLTSLSPLR